MPILSRKLKKTIPLLLKHPSLLAHTIYQTLLFDSALTKEGFLLQGTSSSDSGAEWAGISEIILGNSDWFETWLAGEKDCKPFCLIDVEQIHYTNTVVDDQYNEIISSGDAWLVAEEVNGDNALHDLKPTNSSRRIKSLVEQVTGQLTPILFLHQLSNSSVQTATLNFLVRLREHYFSLKFNCLCWTLTILGYQHPLTHLKLFPLFLFAQCLALCQ